MVDLPEKFLSKHGLSTKHVDKWNNPVFALKFKRKVREMKKIIVCIAAVAATAVSAVPLGCVYFLFFFHIRYFSLKNSALAF